MRKIKSGVRFFVCWVINLLISPSKEIIPNTILLIRLDAIGDYILFRNFIEILKKDEKYKNYKITLVGNIAWKELAENLDGRYIDRFIWIDRNKFNNDFVYRYKKIKEITKYGYEIVLSPVYSREFYFVDLIVKVVNAKEKIGSIGDLSNIRKWQKKITDKYYTKLIPATNDIIFEFYRNKEFFENFLSKKIDIRGPHIDYRYINKFNLPQKYAVLFIGATAKYRKWDVSNFAVVAEYLKTNYGYEIVLSGGKMDMEDGDRFAEFYQKDFINLVGKTSLTDLLDIVSGAELIISNETLLPHLAVALGVKNIFVIYNGNHFGRFIPYPEEITNSYYPIYHPEIEKDLSNYKKLSNSYGFGSNLNINDIKPEIVIKKIDEVLKKGY